MRHLYDMRRAHDAEAKTMLVNTQTEVPTVLAVATIDAETGVCHMHYGHKRVIHNQVEMGVIYPLTQPKRFP